MLWLLQQSDPHLSRCSPPREHPRRIATAGPEAYRYKHTAYQHFFEFGVSFCQRDPVLSPTQTEAGIKRFCGAF
jgi:hypothetical protein